MNRGTFGRIGRATSLIVLILGIGLGLGVFPQLTDEELAERGRWEVFLREAEIVESSRPLNPREAVTEPYRLLLEKNGVQHYAWWKNVDGLYKGAPDYWRCEVAAYELDKLLHLNMVPVCAERRFREERGACSLEMPGLTYRDWLKQDIRISPQERFRYNRLLYLRRAWDNLICNKDRNEGDIIITEDLRMYFIDHSRAFRTSDDLIHTPGDDYSAGEPIQALPRDFAERLAALDFESVKQAVGDYLKDGEIESLLKRKAKIAAEIERLKVKYGDIFLY
jgi:hypothetical protein